MTDYRVYYEFDGQEYTFNIKCQLGENILNTVREHIKELYTLKSTNKAMTMIKQIYLIDCQGCKFVSGGQFSHMEPGGCLY